MAGERIDVALDPRAAPSQRWYELKDAAPTTGPRPGQRCTVEIPTLVDSEWAVRSREARPIETIEDALLPNTARIRRSVKGKFENDAAVGSTASKRRCAENITRSVLDHGGKRQSAIDSIKVPVKVVKQFDRRSTCARPDAKQCQSYNA
jgi:hypothetical protein